MTVLANIAIQSILVAIAVRFVVLLARLEEPMLPGPVVRRHLRFGLDTRAGVDLLDEPGVGSGTVPPFGMLSRALRGLALPATRHRRLRRMSSIVR